MTRWQMLRGESTSREISSALPGWLAAAPDGYKPVVSPARALQAQVLGVELAAPIAELPDEEFLTLGRRSLADAEIFVRDGNLHFVGWRSVDQGGRVLRRPDGTVGRAEGDREVIFVGAYSNSDTVPYLEEFKASLETALGIELKEVSQDRRRFAGLIGDAQLQPAEDISLEEVAAASVLADKSVRELAVAVKSSGGLLVGDAARSVQAAKGRSLQDAQAVLESAGLVQQDVVVLCTKSSVQVTRVERVDLLVSAAELGIRCACGRRIDEERTEKALTITDLGVKLLDKSRWMSVIIFDALAKRGVDIENILLEQTVGGDEVDCLANVFGRVVLFELKDKQFNLGHAYSFGAKIPIFQPDFSVIVTTEHVGGDAKEHFSRSLRSGRRSTAGALSERESRTSDIIYIEGLEEMSAALDGIFTVVHRQQAERYLRDALRLASIDTDALFAGYDDAAQEPISEVTSAKARGRRPAGGTRRSS